ncbi:alpha/beta hydrolase [Oscillatoria sp. FACHB-1406]|uniref:alpha/beta fold hydrolase n=1 Tax=Oscillatoria sp. FACHB-1406 TaxID=2692846 RepID=UPI001681FA05|nr:alpha/beta hydrolase [Oscillatoria sp. FACHB-1406]MBD2579956.1 alpha/beta hydrolase [Oscillatoria sp. FACHB-1406]
MSSPDCILYAQHGWADTGSAIASLAQSVAPPNSKIIVPDLGWFNTWLRIEPLIQRVEAIADRNMKRYPDTPVRIIGHSMGGLIWLEVLHRHPEWRSRVESLILIASPVGGADLARAFDPLNWGLGIARDLGINRREIAQTIAAEIPTLIIAGDIDNGSDGTITVGSTRFYGAHFVCIHGLHHDRLKKAPRLIPAIRHFWKNPHFPSPSPTCFSNHLIQRLQAVPGMTDAHLRDFRANRVHYTFPDGTTLHRWRHPIGTEHIFVANRHGDCLWGGFVGWFHHQELDDAIAELQQEFARSA